MHPEDQEAHAWPSKPCWQFTMLGKQSRSACEGQGAACPALKDNQQVGLANVNKAETHSLQRVVQRIRYPQRQLL